MLAVVAVFVGGNSGGHIAQNIEPAVTGNDKPSDRE
jgi:hypothetical protein